MKTFIFDFDWVIHDSFEFHRTKIEKHCNIKLSPQEYKDLHNWNFFGNKNDKLLDVDWLSYRDFVYKDLVNLTIDNNIKKVLEILNKNSTLHIVSSWWTKNIKDYLKNNWVLEYFSEILWVEHSKSKVEKFNYLINKYKLKKDEIIFVTDTLWDIIEANEVWIKTIAVDFWYHDSETLLKWNPVKIISDFKELLEI